ncbi:MAG: ribosome maturation factor RimP [Bdellovibrionales bacterium]
MQMEGLEKVRDLADQVSRREGCLLYDLEFTGGQNGRILRIYIDRNEGQISLDDCANVSRGLNSILDSDDSLIPGGAYDLEVSSPGVERHLTQPWHFGKAVGQSVRIKTSAPVDGGLKDVTPQTLLDGTLEKFENEILTIRKDDRDWSVPLTAVSKAQLRLEVAKNHPKGKKKR